MTRYALAALALFTLLLPVAAIGDTPWQFFGREPFTGSCEEAYSLIPLDATEIKKDLCRQREKVTVSVDTFNWYVGNWSALTAGERTALKRRAEFHRKTRLFLEDMRAIRTPEALVRKIALEQIDAAILAKARAIMSPTSTCDWMVSTDLSGKHQVTARIVVQPASNPTGDIHPELRRRDLKHYFAADGKNLVAYRFEALDQHHRVVSLEPAICHNTCLKEYPQTLIRRQVRAPEQEPAALALGKPQRPPKLITIYVWEESPMVNAAMQSREFGKLFDERDEPKAPLYSGLVKINLGFEDVPAEKARGRRVYLHDRVTFVPAKIPEQWTSETPFLLEIRNGKGGIAFDHDWVEWIGAPTVVYVEGADTATKNNIAYPPQPPGRVTTCSAKGGTNWVLCAASSGWTAEEGEFYQGFKRAYQYRLHVVMKKAKSASASR